MRRLLTAELSRLRSRRLAWVALVLVLLVVAALQIAVYQTVKPLTAAEYAQGQAQYQQAEKEYLQNKADYDEQEKDCIAQGGQADECHYEPKPEYYTSRTPSTFAEIGEVAVTVSVFVSSLALLFIGASFIGAEYTSGALGNWLTFVPQRGRVFASKLLALVIGSAVVSAVTTALTLGLAALMAHAAGAHVAGVGKLAEMGGRGVAVAVIAGVVGFCLAMLTRHTIAAAGTALGYLLVAYILAILTDSIASLQKIKPWTPELNLLALLQHGTKYGVYTTTITDQGKQQDYVERTLSFAHGTTYWTVLVVVVVGLTLLVFRRRDVS